MNLKCQTGLHDCSVEFTDAKQELINLQLSKVRLKSKLAFKTRFLFDSDEAKKTLKSVNIDENRLLPELVDALVIRFEQIANNIAGVEEQDVDDLKDDVLQMPTLFSEKPSFSPVIPIKTF